jgi:hypothetical protein
MALRFALQPLMAIILLAFVPYLLLRGPIARVTRRWQGSETTMKEVRK